MSIETRNIETSESLSPADKRYLLGNALSAFTIGPLLGAAIGLGITNASNIEVNFDAATAFNDRNDALSELASEVADMPLRIDCNDETIYERSNLLEDGNVYNVHAFVRPLNIFNNPVALPVVIVREDRCDEIVNHTFRSYDPTTDESYDGYITEHTIPAASLGILLHEAEHTKQVFNEAEATCYAVQKLPEALEELGVATADATVIARQAMLSLADGMPDEYFGEECAPGGDYDLAINDLYIQPTEGVTVN